jgi:TonB family protein
VKIAEIFLECAIIALVVRPSAAADMPVGKAAICIQLDSTGHVVDARVAVSSGDETTDQAALQIAKELHWDRPYPKPGWVGIRIGLGTGERSSKVLPTCDPSA